MRGRSWASIYLGVQGALALAWWLLLLSVPASRTLFTPPRYPDSVLLSFWLADLICVAGGSVVAAARLARRDPRGGATLWFTAGALVYAALYCCALLLLTGEAVLAAALMAPAALITLFIAGRTQSR